MRLIPGKTKVQVELFKGVTLGDILIALIAAVLIVFVITSTLPAKLAFVLGVIFLAVVLLVRLDSEPNYLYLLHILRNFAYRRKFRRKQTDREITGTGSEDEAADAEPTETPAERKARLKAEREERKEDDKKLKSKGITKEEEDAIWLKRAQQSAARKQQKKKKKTVTGHAADMTEIIGFTDIRDDLIEYGGEYYGAVLEIPAVEFRFFSANRRNNSIENGLGRILRALPAEYAANIVKLERPEVYDEFLAAEQKKAEAIRSSYERGMITEEEFQARFEIICERIEELGRINSEDKVVEPFYYLVLFDSDKNQLQNALNNALDSLRTGEINARRLGTKELAVFLKYSNRLDFDEKEIENVPPEQYAAWAMPEELSFQHRTVNVDGIVTHNMRIISYPSQVDDAWLAAALSIPATKVVVKCKPMDRDKTIRSIDRSLQELRGQFMATGVDSKRIELQEHIDSLGSLLATIQGDNETLLEVNVYVTAYDLVTTRNLRGSDAVPNSALANINYMKRVVRRIYQENGLRLTNMDFDQVNAFIGSQVNAWDPLHGKGRGIPSNTVAASYPWIFSHISDPNGIKLGSSEGVPVFIDFFRRDSERVNSNMVIVGKSGSGKSYAAKSLLANLAADDSKIFILDPENEYTELAANLHGKFINVGNAQFGRLNPFHIITALDDDETDSTTVSGSYATHLQFLEEFFRQILPDCEKDALEYLNSLIDRMYTNHGINAETDLSRLRPEDYPTFDDLYDAILGEFQSTDNEYIKTMLRTLMNYVSKFSGGGRNANIWNGPSTVTTDENFTVFNFQSLLANRNGSIANAQMLLVLKYIDNEIIKNRDYNLRYKLNRKIVVVIDEAHVFIDTKYPIALDFMYQLAKRIRKYNGMQIVITQNIKDFVGSEEIARKSTAIINACQYSFIFSLAPNDMDDLCKLYEKAGGINESEQEQIVSAPRGQAFTVLSPQSRSSFRVEVPADVVEMFEHGDYVSRYFNGEDGKQAWDEFLGDSRRKHDENVIHETRPSDSNAGTETTKKHVSFIELSSEEYEAANEKKQQEAEEKKAKAERKEEPKAGSEAEPPVIRETAKAAPAPKAPAAPVERVVTPNVVVQTPAASGETERLLGALLDKFSYETMVNEIRRSVQQEMEKEYAERFAAMSTLIETMSGPAAVKAAAPEAGPDIEPDIDLTGETDNTSAPAKADTAPAEEDDAASFDIMSMLLQEAQHVSTASAIEMMEEYGETVLEITLEDLMRYNAAHVG